MALAQLSRTARLHREHTQSAHQVSNVRRSRPQSRSSVPRQHSGCKGRSGSKPLRLGWPPLPVAALWEAASRSRPMKSEPHRLVEGVLDGLRATFSISSHCLVATGWSADLTTAPTCTAEEPTQKARHRQQIGCQSSPAGRAECRAARGTLHSTRAVASGPLSPGRQPPQLWRARRRPRQPPCHKRHGVRYIPDVKGLTVANWSLTYGTVLPHIPHLHHTPSWDTQKIVGENAKSLGGRASPRHVRICSWRGAGAKAQSVACLDF